MRFVALVLLLLGASVSVLAQNSEGDYGIHVVQRGENLFRIALSYDLTTEELATLNGIQNPADIQVGQRLLVPAQADVAAPVPTVALDSPSSTPTAPVTPSDQSIISLPGTTHVVQDGETLFRIASAYGLTVADLAAANDIIDPTRIFAGQTLSIPNTEAVAAALELLPETVDTFYLVPGIFVEGRTTQLRIRTTLPTEITGTFADVPMVVIADNEQLQHTILVGTPVFTEAGEYPLQLLFSDANGVVEFELLFGVAAGTYGSEFINLQDGRDVLLNANVEEAELDLLRNATAAFTPERYWDGSMSIPVAAGITSRFGTLRSYNGGEFDRYHSGTDFAGAPGTPILAPAPGRVVLADTLNVRGNATMIDHGWGIYTGYWHQSEIYVVPGDFVTTGQTIGTVGSTGRVTGAHLHWELWVNGVPVDPMQWVQQDFVW